MYLVISDSHRADLESRAARAARKSAATRTPTPRPAQGGAWGRATASMLLAGVVVAGFALATLQAPVT